MRSSLFHYAGGAAAMLRLAHAHHARCLADPELNHPFSHADQNPQHVGRLATYWGEVLGGPPTYTRSMGTQTELLVMHSGNGDMSDLGTRFLTCFVAAMDDAGLPDEEEFRGAMRAYMTWATWEFNAHPDGEESVPREATVPRWGWDGLQAQRAG